MKVILKQDYISFWHPKYKVLNEGDQILSRIDSEHGFFTKMKIADSDGNYNLVLKKRYFRWPARFDIVDKEGKLQYIVKARFVPFTRKAKILSPDNKKLYDIEGTITGWGFKLFKEGEKDNPIAGYSKKVIALVDQYEIDVVDPANLEFAIAVGVAIDMIYHGGSKRSRSGSTGSSNGGLFGLFK